MDGPIDLATNKVSPEKNSQASATALGWLFCPRRNCAYGAVRRKFLVLTSDKNLTSFLLNSPEAHFPSVRLSIDKALRINYKPLCWPLLSLYKISPAFPYVVICL